MEHHYKPSAGHLGVVYENDPTINEIIKALNSGTRRHPKVTLLDCSIKNNKVHIRDRILVPNYLPLKLKLIMEYHNKPSAGHPDVAKTLELLMRQYTWFGI